ncbi:hlyD secretion family protein, partial [Vibrio parahaemolyticus 970107]
VRLKRSK